MAKGKSEMKELRAALLAWYDANRRDLPWRKTHDPYRIWVSEIMLQQTRVAAVLEHYRAFLEKFPTVKELANAPEADVLAVWSGLGYYRRARMMHRAAKEIAGERGGKFPRSAPELRALPGIGRYTSAAIASIAFGESVAVVDGNVERVLARFDGAAHEGEAVWARAQELMEEARPGDWNQAMMELGATVCTPSEPKCLVCPLSAWCKAPGADVSVPQAQRKKKETVYVLARRKDAVYLVQRDHGASLMAGMWELPQSDTADGEVVLRNVRHSITDTDSAITVVKGSARKMRGGKWIRLDDVATLPLTGLTKKILRKVKGWVVRDPSAVNDLKWKT